MEREQDHFASAHRYTRRFLRDMEAEGDFAQAALRNPRGAEIIQSYYTLGQSLKQIGQNNGIGRERVRQIKDEFIEDLLKHSDPYFQRMYSADLMPRDNDSPYSRFQKALSRGDNTALIAEAVLNNAPREDVLAVAGNNPLALGSRYHTLHDSWGINIDHIKVETKDPKEILAGIAREKNIEGLRERFSEVDQSVYKAMLTHGPNILVMILNMAKAGGYHISPRILDEFVDIIDNSYLSPDQVVPVGSWAHPIKSGPNKGRELRYFFTRFDFVPKAIALWHKTRSLDKYLVNPVRLVAGPIPDQFPTTTNFVNGTYPTFARLLQQLGHKLPVGSTYEDIIPNLVSCPAPIFRWVNRVSGLAMGVIYDPKFEGILKIWLIKQIRIPTPPSVA